MKTKFILIVAAIAVLSSCKKDDEPKKFPEEARVENLADLQEALKQGSSSVTLTTPLTADATFNIPNSFASTEEVEIIIPAAGKNVTISQDGSVGMSYPASLSLDIKEGGNVTVNTGDLTVGFSGKATKLVATTAPATLTIEKGATVGALEVLKGDARIYGTVTGAVTNKGTGKMLYALGAGSDRGAAKDDTFKEVLALTWPDGVILTEGDYPVNLNINAKEDHDVDAKSQLWYFPVEKKGYQLIGDGNRDKIIVYGKEIVPNGSYNAQNMLTVWADNVAIKNITFMCKEEANKVIEIFGSGAVIENCAFKPNTKITDQESFTDNAGGVFFNAPAVSGTVQDCLFNKGQLSFNSIMSGAFSVKNNVFDGVAKEVVLSTRNWNEADVDNSTMQVNGDGNEFKNIPAFTGETERAPIDMIYGKVVLANTKIGTDTYWLLKGNSELTINGNKYVPTPPTE